jgi:hypothetical protein
MPVGAKSTGSAQETYVLQADGTITTLDKYVRFVNELEGVFPLPILRIGFSLTRLKKWKRAYEHHQNSRPVTGR